MLRSLALAAFLLLLGPAPAPAVEPTEALTIRLVDLDGHVVPVTAMLFRPDDAASGLDPAREWPAVVLVHDGYAPDARVGQLASELAERGWAVLAVDLDGASADGTAMPAPSLLGPEGDRREVATRLLQLLSFLAADPLVNPNRIAAVGLGAGGRAALLAGSEHLAARENGPYGPRFAAHAALYPGCGALLAEGFAAPHPWSTAPTALLHAGADDHDIREGCEALRRALLIAGRMPDLWHTYPTATYAWDHGTPDRLVRLPLPGGQRITVRSDAEVTADGVDRLVRFLRGTLDGPPRATEARRAAR